MLVRASQDLRRAASAERPDTRPRCVSMRGAGDLEQSLLAASPRGTSAASPRRVVDLDDERGAVELHRLHVAGDGVADGLVPTPEHATHLPSPTAPADGRIGRIGAQRANDSGRGCRPSGTGSRLTTSPCQLRCAGSASGWAASGSTPAVVSTTWPGGRWRSSAVAPTRVELAEHVVEHQHRRAAGLVGHQSVCGQAQRQRQRALLALRRVGARRHAVDEQLDVVAVRARPSMTPRRTSSVRDSASAAARPRWRHAGS